MSEKIRPNMRPALNIEENLGLQPRSIYTLK